MGAPVTPQTFGQTDTDSLLPAGTNALRRRGDASRSDQSPLKSKQTGYEGRIDARRASHNAVNALWSRMPEYSARTVATRAQLAVLLSGGIAAATAACLWPYISAHVLVAGMSIGFLLSLVFRLVLARIGRRRDLSVPAAPPYDAEMPLYTVLVPLYREAAMLPQLTSALLAIDYPHDCLDIKVVMEEDDTETLCAAKKHLVRLPAEIVVVPPSMPRTKPKACNYALHFAQGEYVVVYDAEDCPEPDQLRRAVKGFRSSPDIACFQARLTTDNEHRSWLARMYTLDYDLWFKMLLPGLSRLRVPIPLGGTSNHFRTQVLRAAGAWDPFNVTEDADLGIRLARLGYGVAMLDSTTFEEAPVRFSSWLRQRTRWMKGYMQTLLVHMRRPGRLVNDIGFEGVATIQFFLGGAVWSAFVNPLLWLIFAVSVISAKIGVHAQAMEMLARLSGISLLTCNMVLAVLSHAGTRRILASAPYALGYLLYWILISVAAYRALWQLVFDPFLWEKTPHGEAEDG